MSNKTLGILLIVVGIVIIVVALFAHQLGLSSSAALGTRKILMAAVGVLVAVAGAGWMVLKKN